MATEVESSPILFILSIERWVESRPQVHVEFVFGLTAMTGIR